MRSKLKLIVVIVTVVTLAAAVFVGFGVWRSASSKPEFTSAGYILMGNTTEVKQIPFSKGSSYSPTLSGNIKFTSTDGSAQIVPKQSFVHLDNAGIMALSDGVLLNFDDLTDNFIHNYYVESGLQIQKNGEVYAAQTIDGMMQFGEHLWKLSEDRYIIVAPTLQVSLGGNNEPRQVNDYVQVTISRDGIVYMLTPENIWMTISETCYVETAGGVKVYPVTKIVDDGTYKLSLVKLSVNVDDSIVLSAGETLLQIVPDFNITGVDGQNGTNGQNGAQGAAGEAGNNGTDGVTGNQGSNGGAGEVGQQGSTGGNGQTGRPGSAGTNGTAGNNGNTGAPGNIGSPGADALVDSSTNSALPTMTIVDWQVTATELKGVIAIADTAGMLEAMSGKHDKYPATVTITDVATNEVISAYQVKYDSENATYDLTEVVEGATGFSDFYTGTDRVAFSTYKNPLTPDTEYRLSVRTYYTTTDDTGLVYSREFISRTFYTDSTGVNLSYVSAATNSITMKATLSSVYAGTVDKVQIYLLTPEQNKTFSASVANSSSTDYYAATQTITAADLGASLSKDVVFTGKDGAPLQHNMTYIARIYVSTTSGLQTVTKQQIEVMTLKRPPEVQRDAAGNKEVPVVTYNRPSGAFEVYRPTVLDPDGGAVSYTYVVYHYVKENESSSVFRWEEKSRRTVPSGTGDPMEFRLESGVDYYFKITMEFFDNEKTVYYDLGSSSNIRAEGDTMPKLSLVPISHDYSKYVGKLIIDLGSQSSLVTNNATTPVTVELYADSLPTGGRTIELSGNAPVFVNGVDDTMGTMAISSATTNRIEISLNLQNLYKKTNYAISVSGHLNVGDGNGATYRAVGTVTFKTYDTVSLIAAFTAPTSLESGGASLSRKLKLAVAPDESGSAGYADRAAYALTRLRGDATSGIDCGQVTISLYQGYGSNMRPLVQQNFSDEEDLKALFGNGLVITEGDFFGIAVDPGATYTMAVTSVSDSSFRETDLGYVNTFDHVINPTGTTAGVTQPPDLLNIPTNGVIATPILNKEAAKFGATVSEILPADAIIGYTLVSNYSNVQRIGVSVTYYAYELSAYINAIQGFDTTTPLPLGETVCTSMQPLMTMTQKVSSTSDSVPAVAVLFGGTKTASDEAATLWNGYNVYYAGDANFTTSLQSGMGRGFQYVFAYEVKYAVGGGDDGEGTVTTNTYPYQHAKYTEYQKLYGGIKIEDLVYGKAYVLSSPVCEAPRILPDFHVYVNNTIEDPMSAWSAATPASGHVVLHYTWRDVEAQNNPTDPGSKMVVTTSGDNQTMITYQTFNLADPTAQVPVGDANYQVAGVSNWYYVSLPYTHTKSDLAILQPTMNISPYRIDYTTYLGGEPEDQQMKLGPIAVDWSWDEMFSLDAYKHIRLQQDTSNLEENYISFYLTGTNVDELAQRATAIRLTFSAAGAPTKTFVLPVIYDATGFPGVRVMTSLLGSTYLHKEYTVSNAVLYYDNGAQGWSLAEQEAGNYILMQYSDDEGLGEYVGAVPNGSVLASGALSKSGTVDVLKGLRATIHAKDPDLDTKVSFYRSAQVDGYTSATQYLYPTISGVNSGGSSNPAILGEKNTVPKSVSTYALSFGTGSTTTGTLTSLTPTVNYNNFSATTSSIYSNYLKVEGFAGEGKIYIAVYDDIINAQALNTNYVKAPKEITVNADGSITDVHDATTVTGLTSDMTYYVTLFYKKVIEGTTETEDIHLIDAKTTGKFVYEITTSDNVTITVRAMDYYNRSYFDKSVVMDFSMSLVYGQTLKYAIYNSQAGAESEDSAALVLSYEQLVAGHLLTEPSVLNYRDNKLTLELEPRDARSPLKPGSTYYMRITSSEGGVQTGYSVQAFALDTLGSYGALIYLTNATSDSISFTVTITDPKYSLMGDDITSGAKYVVRFTDEAGNRLYTTYDDEVYSAFEAGALQRAFTLSQATLLTDSRNPENGIEPSTRYQIHVYAAPDTDHNGSIKLGATNYTWQELFENITDIGGNLIRRFVSIVNDFWNPDGSRNTAVEAAQSDLHIAQEQRSTTTINNWLFNEDGVYTTRFSTNQVRVNFSESVGLIKSDDSPVFTQIDWYVKGNANDGTSIIADGTLKRSRSDTLIQSIEKNGTETYYLDIPYELPQGFYTIVLQLREQEGSEAAEYQITIRSGV